MGRARRDRRRRRDVTRDRWIETEHPRTESTCRRAHAASRECGGIRPRVGEVGGRRTARVVHGCDAMPAAAGARSTTRGSGARSYFVGILGQPTRPWTLGAPRALAGSPTLRDRSLATRRDSRWSGCSRDKERNFSSAGGHGRPGAGDQDRLDQRQVERDLVLEKRSLAPSDAAVERVLTLAKARPRLLNDAEILAAAKG